jgi:hypothetical protein
MSDVTQLALITGTSVLINTVAAAQKKKDVVVPIVAGGIGFVGLALFGGLTNRYDVANAFAWVFLIGSLVLRGMPLLQVSNEVATKGAASNQTAKADNATTSSSNFATPATLTTAGRQNVPF